MINNDHGIVRFKHDIMQMICQLAWEDNLNDESKEKLVYKLIPGPKPMYRCCVYKEREVVRERMKLSLGQTPGGKENDNVVQVIEAACDQCTISAYSVSESCRFCLGKPCLSACQFDAIYPGQNKMHINSDKCKECGKCANACPFGAIIHLERPCKTVCPVDAITYDENGFCIIDNQKCVQCGKCVHSCPFGAIGEKTYLVDIIREIKAGKEVIAMCAPSIEGQFGDDINMASIKEGFKQIGFADMVEVGLGGDLTAAYEALEWSEARKEGRKMTTSCCPAFVNLIKKQFPEIYENNMSKTITPMCAVSRLLKATHPGCVTVFFGPCVAKKSEVMDKSIEGNADYAVTFGEMLALFRSKDIRFVPHENDYQEASIYGKGFASSTGVANAVLECMKERNENVDDIKITHCSGASECFKNLLLLKHGKLDADFIEGMMCEGGCIGGPSKQRLETKIIKSRDILLKEADDRKVLDNLKNYPLDSFSMKR